MPTVKLEIELDQELAQRVRDFCAEVGMSVSKLISTITGDALEDPLALEYGLLEPDAAAQAVLDEMRLMEADPTYGKTYTDIDEMNRDIRAEFAGVPDDEL